MTLRGFRFRACPKRNLVVVKVSEPPQAGNPVPKVFIYGREDQLRNYDRGIGADRDPDRLAN